MINLLFYSVKLSKSVEVMYVKAGTIKLLITPVKNSHIF